MISKGEVPVQAIELFHECFEVGARCTASKYGILPEKCFGSRSALVFLLMCKICNAEYRYSFGNSVLRGGKTSRLHARERFLFCHF